jgi:exosortase/archaeosortase family protein
LTAFAGGDRLAPSASGAIADRTLLIALAAGVATINGSWTNIENSFAAGGLSGLLVDTGGISAVVWFALYAVIAIAREEAGAMPPFRWTDAVVVAMLILASLIPTPLPASFAVLLAGSYLLVLPATHAERRIGTILLALTGTLIWGKLLLEVIAPTLLLRFDTQLVGQLSGTPAIGNTVGFVGGGHFIVAPGCSSLHNMSLALLMWVTVVQLLDLRLSRRVVAGGVLAVLAMLLVNAVRLTTMARLPTYFDMLHTGIGAQLFGWASLILSGIAVAFGVLGATRRSH